ncbi:phage late control D family protein [Amorphus orientalis]|uniref:Phage protein D n=1 Tax=Amorphus orientalis TaxID=649198 RepID=A0AAE3VMP5_9HYPH|nr:late control D family protein [Amorphus orientalis]MDQ0314866.1 phage protein D [Amorphus orientalis]
MPWTVDWQVIVAGVDVTSRWRHYLSSLEVVDKDGESADTCALELDDTDGQVKLPPKGASVSVGLNGVTVFQGTVDRVRSRGAKGGGRTLSVGAKGLDIRSKVKEPLSFHMDDASLQEFLAKAGKLAGLAGVKVSPGLASIARDYWSADAESFLHLGQRLARELAGTFKIRGDQAVLKARGDAATPAGGTLPTVTARYGEGGNVLNWDIEPFAGRREFGRAKVRYFDRETASFKEEEVDFEIEDAPDASNVVRAPVADQAQARETAEARKRDADREGGGGTIDLDLAEEAFAEGTVDLSGTRPGVDGLYRIASRTHRANKNGGATTHLDVKQPAGGAGRDTRKAE